MKKWWRKKGQRGEIFIHMNVYFICYMETEGKQFLFPVIISPFKMVHPFFLFYLDFQIYFRKD